MVEEIVVSLTGDFPIPGIPFYWTIRQRNTSLVPDRAAYSRTTYPPFSHFQRSLRAMTSPGSDVTSEKTGKYKKKQEEEENISFDRDPS